MVHDMTETETVSAVRETTPLHNNISLGSAKPLAMLQDADTHWTAHHSMGILYAHAHGVLPHARWLPCTCRETMQRHGRRQRTLVFATPAQQKEVDSDHPQECTANLSWVQGAQIACTHQIRKCCLVLMSLRLELRVVNFSRGPVHHPAGTGLMQRHRRCRDWRKCCSATRARVCSLAIRRSTS